MPKANYEFLSGPQLLEKLGITDNPTVKWIDQHNFVVGHLPIPQALLMVKSGNFVGKCSTRSVQYIREIETRQTEWIPEYWDGRACGLFRWTEPLTTKSINRCWNFPTRTSSLESSDEIS